MQRITRQIKSYSLTLIRQPTSLKIVARRPIDNFLLEATLTNATLPKSCINLFDNVGEIYEYMERCDAINIAITDKIIMIVVIAIGKLKEIIIPMEVKQISREEILEKKVQELFNHTGELEKRLSQLEKIIKNMKAVEKKPTLPTKDIKEVKNPKDLKKPKELVQRVQQNLFETISNAKTSALLTSNPIGKLISEGADPFTMKKSRPAVITFPFQVDHTSKYFECFSISKNTITLKRDDEQIYMLSSISPIPSTRRHSITFRINKITDGLIWIGLFVQAKRVDQYIGQELGIMMFALDGKKMIVESKPHKLQLPQFKSGSIIKMQIDIQQRKFRLYSDQKKDAIIKVPIPQSMAKQKLYPFVQFISQDDSVTILE